jgi:WD40 repeat protein
VRLGQRPVATAAEGNLAAWALPDGGVKIVDSVTHQEWSIKAHAQGAFCIHFLSSARILTCGNNELRLWTLSHDAPELVAEFSASAFNMARGADGSQLIDGANGEVYLIPPDFLHPLLLHKHSALSFGVAWCDSKACSASWDGQILCSNLQAKSTEVTATFGTPIRWLSGGAGHCFAAVSDGGIYDLRSPASALYKHNYEPFRLAVSQDATRIASGDWNGTLKVWDTTAHQFVATVEHLHAGLVTAIGWNNNGTLVTAGFDGFVKILSRDFTLIHSWQLQSPIHYMSASDDHIYAVLNDGTLWSVSLDNGVEHRISFGTTLTTFSRAPSGKYIAIASDNGEIFIVDNARSITAKRLEHDTISCATFQDDKYLLFCAPGGRMLRLAIDAQRFELDQI